MRFSCDEGNKQPGGSSLCLLLALLLVYRNRTGVHVMDRITSRSPVSQAHVKSVPFTCEPFHLVCAVRKMNELLGLY